MRLGMDLDGTLNGRSGKALVKLVKAAKGTGIDVWLVTATVYVSDLKRNLAKVGLRIDDFAGVQMRGSLEQPQVPYKAKCIRRLKLDLMIDDLADEIRAELGNKDAWKVVKVWT